MKQSDIASLLLIVAISFTIAYFIGNSVFNTPESRSTEVEVVNEIEGQMPDVSEDIFNEAAINPTEDIRITPSDNEQHLAD